MLITTTTTTNTDGYKSLLIEEEGGQAIEIVSEENGILISMLLRQYFMSLKVLDRWSNLGPHMSKHWDKVASSVSKSHPCLPPKRPGSSSSPVAATTTKPASASGKKGWEHFTPAKIRARRSSVGPLTERETDVDDDSPPTHPPHPPAAAIDAGPLAAKSLSGIREDDEDEKELGLLRKFFRRWCHKAGVHAEAGSELEEDEVDCDWTQAIAPKLEGRIVMVGA